MFHVDGTTYEYGETILKDFLMHFINRHLYPVVLLKTTEEVERFADATQEWQENTPFYQSKYEGFGELFSQFRKTTRVIMFVKDKGEFKEEMGQLKDAARQLASRDDLRIARVSSKNVISDLKDKYGLEWFNDDSSNMMLLIKKDMNNSKLITKKYDFTLEVKPMAEWISEASLEPLEELSGTSFKIISRIKRPMIIAFIDRDHYKYGAESVQAYNAIKQVALENPFYVFTYTEEDRYRATKKGKWHRLTHI